MKRFVLFISLLIGIQINLCLAQQDIANGDFEFWDTIPGTNGLEDPIAWPSNNLGLATCTSGNYITGVSKSTDAYSGNFSVRISPSNNGLAGGWSNKVGIGLVTGNCIPTNCFGIGCDSIYPVSYRHQKVVGYYKYFPDPLVWDTVRLDYYQNFYNTVSGMAEQLSFNYKWFQPASNWTYFEVPIAYFYPLPITAFEFSIGVVYHSTNISALTEAYFLLDSLAIVPDITTGLNEISLRKTVRLSPNPAGELLTITSVEKFDNFVICNTPHSLDQKVHFLS